MKSFLGFSVLFLLTVPAFAEDLGRIVVSSSRTEIEESKVASSVTIITKSDLEGKQIRSVADVLRQVPGLAVVRSGPLGGATTVFMRGMDGGNTLVLLDGVAMNDPMEANRSFNWANLNIGEIERIEILRGPQSVVWGGNAMGGVIQIITQKGKGPASGRLQGEFGAQNTQRVGARVAGEKENLSYSLGANAVASEGISSADSHLGNTEKDGYRNESVLGHFGWKDLGPVNLDFLALYSDSQTDLDYSAGPPGSSSGDDPNYKQKSREFFSKGAMKTQLAPGQKLEASLGYSHNIRSDNNDPDAVNTSISHNAYNSYRLKPGVLYEASVMEGNSLIVGAEYELERGYAIEDDGSSVTDTRDSVNTRSLFVQDSVAFGGFFANLGGRVDGHNKFGKRYTYRFAPGYEIENLGLKVRGSVGTAFKPPSIYQLSNPTYGNSKLKAEDSFGYDLGFEKVLPFSSKLGMTFFKNQTKNLISGEPAPSYRYINLGRVLTYGVETAATSSAFSKLDLSFQHTYTIARNEDTHKDLLRRPMHHWTLDADYHATDLLKVGMTAEFVGARKDTDAVTFKDRVMSSYTLFGLRGRYDFNPGFYAMARIDNLLDLNYQESDGYGTPGRGLFVGLSKEL